MANFNFDLFKSICEANAISGDEKELVKILKNEYSKYCDEIIYDNLGSVVAYKKSKKKGALKVLVLSHADEIGFMVSNIDDKGKIKVNPIGGINPNTLLADRVVLRNDDGKLFNGVISNNSSDSVSSLEFDFGFDSKEEVLNNNISVGNSVHFVGDAIMINEKRIVSKAIDNRYGCFLGVELLEELKDSELDIDLYVGASVQEEVGCRGALTITNKIKPDFAIILDCSPSDEKNGNGILGKGVLLRVKDANMLAFKSLINYQREICEKVDVPCQYFISMGGTDAGMVHKSFDGVLTMTHCICAKNLHTSSTMMDINDYLSAKKSLVYMIKDLNKEKIEKFKEGNR